jgi:hypothetical protein
MIAFGGFDVESADPAAYPCVMLGVICGKVVAPFNICDNPTQAAAIGAKSNQRMTAAALWGTERSDAASASIAVRHGGDIERLSGGPPCRGPVEGPVATAPGQHPARRKQEKTVNYSKLL